jgi:hypothetical protein
MPDLLLEGHVDTRDQEIATLTRRLAQIDEALRLERIKNAAIESGVRELRHVTRPLLGALQKIHGLCDEMGVTEAGASPAGSNSKWAAIKQRNPGRIAEAIDTLLVHGSLNSSQLAAAMHIDRSNCSKNVIPKLVSMGLIRRDGRLLSLKEM